MTTVRIDPDVPASVRRTFPGELQSFERSTAGAMHERHDNQVSIHITVAPPHVLSGWNISVDSAGRVRATKPV